MNFTNRKPPMAPYIERHPERPEEFFCEHPEMKGRYIIHKPNFGRDMAVERVKSALLGTPNPTPEAERMAEWAAIFEVAFDEKPSKIVLDDIVDNAVLAAVYSEVVSYWKCFRVPDET